MSQLALNVPTFRWSDQQEAIFEWFARGKGNLKIVARAGCAKTTSVVEGVSRAPESKILMAAFNKRIATELQDKLKSSSAEAKTLHSLGYKFLMRNWNKVALDENRGFRICERLFPTAPQDMMKLICQLTAAGKNVHPFGSVAQLTDLAMDRDITADEDWAEEGWTPEKLATCAHAVMAKACERDGTIDYDDMVFVPVRNGWVRPWFDLVVIDEAQDMNACQLIIAQKSSRGRVCVVGDDRQAIYGFRGAVQDGLNKMGAELNAAEMRLTVTRRCPKRIVEVARQYVPDFQAAPEAPEGVVAECNADKMEELCVAGDFILSRKNAPLVGICLRLLRAGKRAKVEGRDIGASLCALVKKLKAKSIPDFLKRLTVYQMQQETRIRASAKRGDEDKTDRRIDEVKDKVDTLRELAEGMAGLKELEARITDLFQDVGAKGGQVVCSSIHKSKGLEADRVFILRETLRTKPWKDRNGVEHTPDAEEFNIAYVAVTRAKRELVWVDGIS